MTPIILPLGDQALLVRFDDKLSDDGNRAAVGFATRVEEEAIPGVLEVAPNLVSVLVRYDPLRIGFDRLAGEIRLLVSAPRPPERSARQFRIDVVFDGEDLGGVAAALQLTEGEFVARHNAEPLRVLATGFAPGFVYCGFHPESLSVPRRPEVRPMVPAGTVLFAAGQTAITSTPIPTGWHVIGHTPFRNFDALAKPPSVLAAGDEVVFEVAP